MRKLLIILSLLAVLLPAALLGGEGISVTDARDREIEVEVLPADGDLLVIWLVDHEELRSMFEGMLQAVQGAGIEVWRVDLLRDFFLPRSNENIRTLDGGGVAALIAAAHEQSRKRILLAAYDRMPLPLLRGLRDWQARHGKLASRLSGAILFYPNLFGPSPLAGELPWLDPIVAATNYPVTLVQPELGSHRWRFVDVMNTLWQADSPAFAVMERGVRDWYFMHEPDGDPAERAATKRVPSLLRRAAHLMEAMPRPAAPAALTAVEEKRQPVHDLVRLAERRSAPNLALPALDGEWIRLSDHGDKVSLISFWATWCPPCVEELPSLNRLKRRYEEKPFAILSVDFQEPAEHIREFTGRIPVDFPVLLDADGRTSLAWRVFSFPSSFLVDRQGRIRYSVNRAIDWDNPEVWEIIDGLLAEEE